MAVLPASKYFRLVKGATFDYSFQYLIGTIDESSQFDLTGYTGTWTIHAPDGNLTYSTGALSGHSGVFFGGPTHNVTNGIIDLVISSTDTTGFTWTTAPYTFSIASPDLIPVVTPILQGSINVVLSLP